MSAEAYYMWYALRDEDLVNQFLTYLHKDDDDDEEEEEGEK